MTDLSLVIRNARIVDGSGAEATHGDVGVSTDRIVSVGCVEGRGAYEIDAAGKVLAPGFIDIHTHYDPQLCWDRLATPSPQHGVTSLIMGNCSISLAPVKKEQRQKVIHMFGSVEDMEGRLLENTVPFSWQSFPEYLEYLGQGLGPNVGVFVGHSVLRFYVMGTQSQERKATDAEIGEMCEALRGAVRAGAFGLSFSYGHLDEKGNKLPCMFADRKEKLALMQVMAEEGRGMIEATPDLIRLNAGLRQIDEFGELALESGVTCSISPVLEVKSRPGLWREMLDRFEFWQAKGAPLYAQTQTRPLDMTTRLSQGSASLSKMPSWRRLMDLSLSDRIASFGNTQIRVQLDAELPMLGSSTDFLVVKRVINDANKSYVGRKVVEIAQEEGKTFTDAFLDIALADELETEFSQVGMVHSDVKVVSYLLNHPGIHIGSADAGAHITQFSGVGDTCYLFEKFVRQEGSMSLERAVQRLTSDLAHAWRITDRGEIAAGKYADLVLFDPATIRRGKEYWANDVPGGSGRYVRSAFGIDKVFVNGALLVDNGNYTSNRTGRII